MKSFFLFLTITITSTKLIAQQKIELNKIQILFGRSTHGTGDMSGLSFSTDYQKYYKPRLLWSVSIGGSIHNRDYPIFFNSPRNPNEIIDGSIRSTTAGVQIAGHIGYGIIKSKKHDFQFRLGSLLRYQSSSYYDEVQVLFPLFTGLTYPVVVFNHSTPQNTFALGGSTQLVYNYSLKNNFTIGSLAGFQIDTNGDVITQLSLSIGKRF